jgi:hypothetical protein
MWLPAPIYKRIPQCWFLLGLLFIATGLYSGFELPLIFMWQVIVGIGCCIYGIGIFLFRLRYRKHRTVPDQEQHA